MSCEDITCPITYQIFLNPVRADDKHVYEKKWLQKWLLFNDTSPLTRKNIKSFRESKSVKKKVERYLKEHPDKKEDQFIEEMEPYIENEAIIDKIVWVKEWNLLLDYKDIDLSHFLTNYGIKKLPENIVKHLIDHAIFLEAEDYKGFRIIHHVCKYSTPKMVEYIIEKRVNLECQTSSGWRPVHFIAKYQTPEIMCYIAKRMVDLSAETNNGTSALKICFKRFMAQYDIACLFIDQLIRNDYPGIGGIVCRYFKSDVVKYYIDNMLNIGDLESEDMHKWRLIHYVCKYQTPEMIKYLIDKGVSVNCETGEGYLPIHLIKRGSLPEDIKKLLMG